MKIHAVLLLFLCLPLTAAALQFKPAADRQSIEMRSDAGKTLWKRQIPFGMFPRYSEFDPHLIVLSAKVHSDYWCSTLYDQIYILDPRTGKTILTKTFYPDRVALFKTYFHVPAFAASYAYLDQWKPLKFECQFSFNFQGIREIDPAITDTYFKDGKFIASIFNSPQIFILSADLKNILAYIDFRGRMQESLAHVQVLKDGNILFGTENNTSFKIQTYNPGTNFIATLFPNESTKNFFSNERVFLLSLESTATGIQFTRGYQDKPSQSYLLAKDGSIQEIK